MPRKNPASTAPYVPIDARDQSSVRALILARTSSTGGGWGEVESQVQQSLTFIEAMGWTLIHPDDPYAYSDSKTGMHQVRRPALTNALKMAQRDEVDVIVCLKLARIDRRAPKRVWAIQVAEDFGVEFRFVNHPETRGKLPEGELAELQRFIQDMYDEREAREIAERLSPGKLDRYVRGLPHGGSTGPNYGYKEGERRYKGDRADGRGKPMGLLTWVVDEEKAAWVRWLFDLVDATPVADLTVRGLTRALIAAGAPTATGAAEWGAKQVSNILGNGKYAGLGRNLRRRRLWRKKRDLTTNEVLDTTEITLRPEDETYEVITTACPPLVSREQFERVQAKLKDAAALHPRGGPRRADPAAHSSLLDGYVFCAHCGGKMTRKWDKRGERPYYACNKQSGLPSYPCRSHEIAAWDVDALVLAMLARTLTDPEKILAMADAAASQLTAAEGDAALAEAGIAAYGKVIADIAAKQEKWRGVVRSMTGVEDAEAMLADARAKLDALAAERTEAEAARAAATPARDHATERVSFLRSLFTTRDVSLEYHGPGRPPTVAAIGEPYLDFGSYVVFTGKDGESITYSRLTPAEAAALLGVPEDEIDLPILRGVQAIYGYDDGAEVVIDLPDFVDANDVIELLLKRMPRDRLRKTLDDLKAVVRVTRPRTAAERKALGGWTPVAERVSLELLGSVVVRLDGENLTGCRRSRTPCLYVLRNLSNPDSAAEPRRARRARWRRW